ncbi:Tapt1 family like protein [Aduncisulcus paluster]|uniref:Tapt1 family like protein n=1 Tax=Aduncisulcus paluster TaxID=2918883 RepID=A0ABQ5KGP9_9EUKA|nr:Tapt1 family like protein [Aduncisulcus paluster]
MAKKQQIETETEDTQPIQEENITDVTNIEETIPSLVIESPQSSKSVPRCSSRVSFDRKDSIIKTPPRTPSRRQSLNAKQMSRSLFSNTKIDLVESEKESEEPRTSEESESEEEKSAYSSSSSPNLFSHEIVPNDDNRFKNSMLEFSCDRKDREAREKSSEESLEQEEEAEADEEEEPREYPCSQGEDSEEVDKRRVSHYLFRKLDVPSYIEEHEIVSIASTDSNSKFLYQSRGQGCMVDSKSDPSLQHSPRRGKDDPLEPFRPIPTACVSDSDSSVSINIHTDADDTAGELLGTSTSTSTSTLPARTVSSPTSVVSFSSIPLPSSLSHCSKVIYVYFHTTLAVWLREISQSEFGDLSPYQNIKSVDTLPLLSSMASNIKRNIEIEKEKDKLKLGPRDSSRQTGINRSSYPSIGGHDNSHRSKESIPTLRIPQPSSDQGADRVLSVPGSFRGVSSGHVHHLKLKSSYKFEKQSNIDATHSQLTSMSLDSIQSSPFSIVVSTTFLLLHSVIHTILMQCQMTTLLIAISSKSVSLVSLMISTRFKVLKKVVLRRQGDRTIFQTFLADAHSRFTTLLYIVLMSFASETWVDIIPEFLLLLITRFCDKFSWIEPESVTCHVAALCVMISVVLRRQGDRTIFQTFLADAHSRFTTLLYIVLMSFASETWVDIIPEFLLLLITRFCDKFSWIEPESVTCHVAALCVMISVYIMDLLIDWTKHCFILRHNTRECAIYSTFKDLLLDDIVSSESNSQANDNNSSVQFHEPSMKHLKPWETKDIWTKTAKRVGFSPVSAVSLVKAETSKQGKEEE